MGNEGVGEGGEEAGSEKRGREGEGRKIGGKEGREKEEINLRVRSARSSKRGGGRQGVGEGWKGETPPHLVHPSRKKHKCLIFGIMADFNPRRQYIGVSENLVTVTVSSIFSKH